MEARNPAQAIVSLPSCVQAAPSSLIETAKWEPSARAAAMERLAVELEARAGEMAQRVSAQNGMPISIATVLEGGFPVIVLRYLAGLLAGASFEEERPGWPPGAPW
jgi:aldehyde dehydrogenase (NAD+)